MSMNAEEMVKIKFTDILTSYEKEMIKIKAQFNGFTDCLKICDLLITQLSAANQTLFNLIKTNVSKNPEFEPSIELMRQIDELIQRQKDNLTAKKASLNDINCKQIIEKLIHKWRHCVTTRDECEEFVNSINKRGMDVKNGGPIAEDLIHINSDYRNSEKLNITAKVTDCETTIDTRSDVQCIQTIDESKTFVKSIEIKTEICEKNSETISEKVIDISSDDDNSEELMITTQTNNSQAIVNTSCDTISDINKNNCKTATDCQMRFTSGLNQCLNTNDIPIETMHGFYRESEDISQLKLGNLMANNTPLKGTNSGNIKDPIDKMFECIKQIEGSIECDEECKKSLATNIEINKYSKPNDGIIGEKISGVNDDHNSQLQLPMITTATTNCETLVDTTNDVLSDNSIPVTIDSSDIDIDDNTDCESEVTAKETTADTERNSGHNNDCYKLCDTTPIKSLDIINVRQYRPTKLKSTAGRLPNELYACDWPECGFTTKCNRVLISHTNAHMNIRPYACEWPGCEYRSSWRPCVRKHQYKHRRNKCQKAGSSEVWAPLADTSTPDNHLPVTTSTTTGQPMFAYNASCDKPYVCQFPDCGYSTKWPASVTRHINSHPDSRPYVCGRHGCEFRTNWRRDVIKHEMEHRNNEHIMNTYRSYNDKEKPMSKMRTNNSQGFINTSCDTIRDINKNNCETEANCQMPFTSSVNQCLATNVIPIETMHGFYRESEDISQLELNNLMVNNTPLKDPNNGHNIDPIDRLFEFMKQIEGSIECDEECEKSLATNIEINKYSKPNDGIIGEKINGVDDDHNSQLHQPMISTQTTNCETLFDTSNDFLNDNSMTITRDSSVIDSDDNTDCESKAMAKRTTRDTHQNSGHNNNWHKTHAKRRNLKSIADGLANGLYACDWPDCGFTTYYRHSLISHTNVHKNIKPYACEWPGCDYRTSYPAGIKKHRLTHMNDTYCQKAGSSEVWEPLADTSTPDNHLPVTASTTTAQPMFAYNGSCDKPYVCQRPDCGFATKWLRDIIAHSNAHKKDIYNYNINHNSRQQPIITTEIETIIDTSNELLSDNSKVVTLDSSAIDIDNNTDCESHNNDCHKTRDTTPIDSLDTIHVRQRGRQKFKSIAGQLSDGLYACDWPECEFTTKYYQNLVSHTNVHNNIKPYACEWPGCEYRSSYYSGLYVHLLKHMDNQQSHRQSHMSLGKPKAHQLFNITFMRNEKK